MNELFGATSNGKRRLAALIAREKEAAANPILGRSRAERLLDDTLKVFDSGSLTSSNGGIDSHRIIEPVQRKRQRVMSKSTVSDHSDAADTVPPYKVLYNLLRRLDLGETKFARTCELLKRFFETPGGREMLEIWRRLMDEDVSEMSKVVSEALEKRSWLILYAAWKLALIPYVTTNGDARTTVIELFESVFVTSNETPTNVIKLEKFRPEEPLVLLQKDTPSDDILTWLKEDDDNNKTILSLSNDEKNVLGTIDRWRDLFNQLIPICRISALAHNLLYHDDAHIFHRGLNYIEEVNCRLPLNSGPVVECVTLLEQLPNISQTDFTAFQWTIPNRSQRWALRRDLFWRCLPTLIACSSRPWARVSVVKFFNELFIQRKSKFTILEMDKIEKWQSQLLDRQSRNQKETNITSPGVAPVPVKDVRIEVITCTSGVGTWADRQLT